MNDTHEDEDDNEGRGKDASPQVTTEALDTSFRIPQPWAWTCLFLAMRLCQSHNLTLRASNEQGSS